MGFLTILKVAGSLAFFIYGMKIMSDGIQRAAGVQLRLILRSLTRNRFLGLLTGVITTGAVQSSSATTVMTVSLVNAGLITLVQSAGLMLGANIGTTITAWIIAGIGFRVSLQQLIIPLLILGVPMFFSNRGRFKFWGEFIIGFVIIFLGLNFLSESVPDINQNQDLLEWIKQYTDTGLFSIILFVALGAVLTIIIQSSSAAIALTMTVCLKGWLPFELGAAMILGENIGTTITAEIAALVGNVQARRSARVHSLFNILGVLWMVILLPLAIDVLSKLMVMIPGVQDPVIDINSAPIGLAIFHTIFNVINGLIFLGLLKYLVRLAEWTVSAKKGEDQDGFSLISNSAMSPELAELSIREEISKFGDRIINLHQDLISLINSVNKKETKKIIKKIRKYKEESEQINIEITDFITKTISNKSSTRTSINLRSYLDVCNDLERLGEIYHRISIDFKKKRGDKIWFSPEQRNSLVDLSEMIREALNIMNRNISTTKLNQSYFNDAIQIHKQISSNRELLRDEYLKNKDLVEENIKGSIIYVNIVTLLQSLNNHILHVSESLHR